MHQLRSHDRTGLLCDLIAEYALSASLLRGKFVDRGTFAHTVFGYD